MPDFKILPSCEFSPNLVTVVPSLPPCHMSVLLDWLWRRLGLHTPTCRPPTPLPLPCYTPTHTHTNWSAMHNEDLNIGTVTMFDTWWKIVRKRKNSLEDFFRVEGERRINCDWQLWKNKQKQKLFLDVAIF